MDKYKFVAEFEIKASPKILYPYLSTPAGLSQWIADDVTVNEDNIYFFYWDNETFKARLTNKRTNHYVKFDFLDDDNNENDNFIDLALETSELTQTVYLKITDYSENNDKEELYEMWHNQVDALKEMVGG